MKKVSRREFIGYSLANGALLISAPTVTHADKRSTDKANSALTPLVEIKPDNTITFFYPSPEMGQGVDTSLAQLFIDELGADMNLVQVAPMPYGISKDDEGKIVPISVPQFAGGSTSISRNYTLLREAGASTRELFIQAAAQMLTLDTQQLSIEASYVVSAVRENNREQAIRIPLGQLVAKAAQQTLPADYKPTLKSPQDWTSIGHATKAQQVKNIVTGEALYGMDMAYPDAKIALIARSPFLDGYAESIDSEDALKLPGVHAVLELERPDLDKNYTYLAAGIAVIADDFWTAKKARDLLKIKWNGGPHAHESSKSLDNQCRDYLNTPLGSKGQIVRDDGDFERALKSADTVLTRRYQLPLVSHAQLEPQNCIAHVTESHCFIQGPLQSPGGASRMAAQLTGLDRLDIDIQYTRLGGGFGRRLTNDHVAEAVTISKLSGYPIKLMWTREDDMAHDFYRPMGHHEVTAGVDKEGKVVAWSHRLAGTPKYYRRDNVTPDTLFGADLYVDDFPAGLVENIKHEYFAAKSGAPQGSWRAPAHTANAFVIQSFLDELANELGQDPLALRLSMLGESRPLPYAQHGGPVFDTGRMAAVLNRAASMADWGRAMPPNRGLGLAGHFTFGGYCAQVAEVELMDDDTFRVHRVDCAIDVGLVVNPLGIITQMEGGINDGLSAALGQQILIDKGQVITKNFDTYRMLRMADSVRDINVSIISSDASPAGAGEMGLPPVAPAVANALASAGGPRLRAHPMRK